MVGHRFEVDAVGEHLDPAPRPAGSRRRRVRRDRELRVVERIGHGVGQPGGHRIAVPRVVLGVDDRGTVPHRAQRHTGDGGHHRRMDVDDVDPVLADERPQLDGPAEIEVAPRTEPRTGDPEGLERGDDRVRSIDKVGSEVPEVDAVADPGVGFEESLHAPRAEALRQPEHPDRTASGHGRHQNNSMSPSARSRSDISGTSVRASGRHVRIGPSPGTGRKPAVGPPADRPASR